MITPARHPRWQLASAHHRRFRSSALELSALLLRLVAVALLSGVVWIHIHLWQEGYKHIPTIGPLFLVGAFTALAVTTVFLVWPTRLGGLLSLTVDLGILASLIASINIGLFGFKETLTGAFAIESIVIESLAAAALTAWISLDLAAEHRAEPDAESPRPAETDADEEPSWTRRAQQAEADADELARALDFHIVNECDCHGAADIATLRRHDIRVISRQMSLADREHSPVEHGIRPIQLRGTRPPRGRDLRLSPRSGGHTS